MEARGRPEIATVQRGKYPISLANQANSSLLASAPITSVGVRLGVRSAAHRAGLNCARTLRTAALKERTSTDRAGVASPSVCLAVRRSRNLGRRSCTHRGSTTGSVRWAVPPIRARYAPDLPEAGITSVMSVHQMSRQPWPIDRLLARFAGHDVRVAGRAFAPGVPTAGRPLRFLQVADLILPDGSQPGAVPFFFEGRLREFERRIGVVVVSLDALAGRDTAPEGWVQFRGQAAVVLQGPAVVELASPFHVERLPSDPANYWRDLRSPRVQFEFDLTTTGPAPLPKHLLPGPGVAPAPPASRRQGRRQR